MLGAESVMLLDAQAGLLFSRVTGGPSGSGLGLGQGEEGQGACRALLATLGSRTGVVSLKELGGLAGRSPGVKLEEDTVLRRVGQEAVLLVAPRSGQLIDRKDYVWVDRAAVLLGSYMKVIN